MGVPEWACLAYDGVVAELEIRQASITRLTSERDAARHNLEACRNDLAAEQIAHLQTRGLVTSPSQFKVGEQVEKVGGDYKVQGEVRLTGTTKAGKVLYGVEIAAEKGGSFLHIYSDANLRRVE
jgi:hypothetical protein